MKWVQSQMVLLLLLVGLFSAPNLHATLYDAELSVDYTRYSEEEPVLPIGYEHPEYGTLIGYDDDGDPKYTIRIPVSSKASMMLSPDNVEKTTWDDDGDGHISGYIGNDPMQWEYSGITMNIGKAGGMWYESWLSFALGSTFENPNVIKSIDDLDLEIKCEAKVNLEGNEEVEAKKMGTNNECGKNGDSDCNSYDEIYEWSRSGSKVVATSEFSAGSWKNIDLDTDWIPIGYGGQLNIYLEEDGFGDSERISLYTSDSSGNEPYLDIDYTLWSAPTANAVDITGEPTNLLPWQNYEVQTIVADADGRTNINNAYLYLSADHSSYLVRFDWIRATDTFSQGVGNSYVELNTADCASTTNGATGWELNWNFTVSADWLEGSMDWANYATDAQGKTSGVNWNDENTWYTDRLWLYDLDVEWISESKYLEDGDYVYTSQGLNITGYVYWNLLTTAYDLDQGIPRAELIEDGMNNGTYYNCSIDSSGYFNISYTTATGEDWDWSLDVELNTTTLPTGLTEAPSNDNGKSPLFLITASSPAFGASGTTVTLTIQPGIIVPSHLANARLAYLHNFHLHGSWHSTLTNDGAKVQYRTGVSTQDYFGTVEFQSPYWLHANDLTYDVNHAGADMDMGDYNPATAKICDYTSPTGTHAIELANWFFSEGEIPRLAIYFVGHAASSGSIGYDIDQLTIDFNAFTETRVAERNLNTTSVIDMVEFEVKAPNTNISITGLPMTYSYSYMLGNSSYEDSISSTGLFKLYNTHTGTYKVYFDTALTWHDVTFKPKLPDGLFGQWDDYSWWANETEITESSFPLSHGFYHIFIQDAYGQNITVSSITILAKDNRYLSYSFNVPMFRVGITNQDEEPYYILILREDTVGYQPLSPGFVLFRLYGLASGANYYCTVYNSTDAPVGNFTIPMKDKPFSYVVDYVTEEEVEFTVIYSATVIVDDVCTVSGWVTWTNGTNLSDFAAYGNWEGGGFETLTKDGSAFYGSHTYTTIGTKILQIRMTVSGQANVTKTYTISVVGFFSASVILKGHIPAEGKPQEPISVYGTVRYANGTDLSGSVVTYWNDGTGSSSTSLVQGAYSLTHTYKASDAYTVAINYGLKWLNGTILIRADMEAGPGGTAVFYLGLPRDLWAFFILPTVASFTVLTYVAWRVRERKPKPIQRPVTAAGISKQLMEDAKQQKRRVRT